MTRPTWDTTWLQVADIVARRSLCDGRAIGAVIVDPRNRVVSTGYNGAPAGFAHHHEGCRRWCPRMQAGGERTIDYTNCVSVHAEANALAFADRRSYEGGTLYVTSAICWDCGKQIANSGIHRVVMNVWRSDEHRDPRRTITMMQRCGITVHTKTPEA